MSSHPSTWEEVDSSHTRHGKAPRQHLEKHSLGFRARGERHRTGSVRVVRKACARWPDEVASSPLASTEACSAQETGAPLFPTHKGALVYGAGQRGSHRAPLCKAQWPCQLGPRGTFPRCHFPPAPTTSPDGSKAGQGGGRGGAQCEGGQHRPGAFQEH